MLGSWLWLLGSRDGRVQCDDEPVRTATGGGFVVIARNERVDGGGKLDGERGSILCRGEPHFAVDPERRERLSCCARAGDELTDLVDEPCCDCEQPASGALIRPARRIGCERRKSGG